MLPALETTRRPERWPWLVAAAALLWYALAGVIASPAPAQAPPSAAVAPLPEFLHETGLYAAGSRTAIDPRNLPYAPQYPLWTDGAAKRRWIRLPEGATIDATAPDAWRFPAGTRFWKEFSFGRRVETRYFELTADGSVRYATYVWSEDGREARLAPPDGARDRARIDDGTLHDVPSLDDCRACHEGRRSPVLGFSALQLSPDRDPNAVHAETPPAGALDLPALARAGLLSGLPERLLREPPRLPGSPTARAALGYLHGNCGGCHNAEGPLASLGLDLDGDALRTAVGVPSRYALPGQPRTLRVEPGRPDASALVFRMASRFAAARMPPLGTELVDTAALELVRRWISEETDNPSRK